MPVSIKRQDQLAKQWQRYVLMIFSAHVIMFEIEGSPRWWYLHPTISKLLLRLRRHVLGRDSPELRGGAIRLRLQEEISSKDGRILPKGFVAMSQQMQSATSAWLTINGNTLLIL